jgi:hypothetical protein
MLEPDVHVFEMYRRYREDVKESFGNGVIFVPIEAMLVKKNIYINVLIK